MRRNRTSNLAVASLVACLALAGCHSAGQHVALAPPSEPVPKLNAVQQADIQVALAQSLEKTGTPDQAAALYVDAVKRDPRRADAYDRLGVMHGRQGQWEQALEAHKKALDLQPGNANFHCNLGYCYYLQRRWDEAEASLKKALELSPEHKRARNNLGLVQAHTGREAQARVSFRQAGCSEADAQCNLGLAASLENSLPAARAHFERALKLDPANASAQRGQQLVSSELTRQAAPPANSTLGFVSSDSGPTTQPPENVAFQPGQAR